MKTRARANIRGDVGAVILAAGESSRMGRPKQTIRYDGESMLRRACRAALNAGCHPVIVVLGAKSEVVNEELSETPVQVTLNLKWQEGMSSSIHSGVQALSRSELLPRAVILMLADQPMITSQQLLSLINVFRKTNCLIVASQYGEPGDVVQGAPAIFGRELFAELLQLRGAKGARSLIKKYESIAEFVAVPEAAIDIDTPLDLEKLNRNVAEIEGM